MCRRRSCTADTGHFVRQILGFPNCRNLRVDCRVDRQSVCNVYQRRHRLIMCWAYECVLGNTMQACTLDVIYSLLDNQFDMKSGYDERRTGQTALQFNPGGNSYSQPVEYQRATKWNRNETGTYTSAFHLHCKSSIADAYKQLSFQTRSIFE
jgi:hypothetical protein